MNSHSCLLDEIKKDTIKKYSYSFIMASLCSSPEPDSSPSTPDLNEHSRLLPDLDEEIISVMGEVGTVIARDECRRNQSLSHPTNNCGNSHCADLACEARVL